MVGGSFNLSPTFSEQGEGMALKISLAAGEKVIIGGAVITNSGVRCKLSVENRVTVLREKDIMKETDANTPCQKIYLSVQLMYIDEENVVAYHNAYWELVRDVLAAAPSTLSLIDPISQLVLNGEYYKALKLVQKLIDYEEETLKNARESSL